MDNTYKNGCYVNIPREIEKLISDGSSTTIVLTILKISATIDSVDVEIIDPTEMAACING